MAITKTLKLKSIRYNVYPDPMPAQLFVEYDVIVDDPTDDMLPVCTQHSYGLTQDSDTTNEEELVQKMFNLVFNK
jgi:hypothetical protein